MSAAINAMGASSVASAKAYTDHQVTELQKFAARGVAASMASNAQLALAPGETGVAVGTGYYDRQSAIGLALRHMTGSGTQFNVAGGVSDGGKLALQAGVGWKW